VNPPLQTIRLSKKEVDILNALKRKLKITQWNILCRMAYCLSCADPLEPPTQKMTSTDSVVEIEWNTFSGNMSELYASLCQAHKLRSKSDTENPEYFKKLLFRGITRLKDSM